MRLELLVGQSARGILQGWATGVILGLYWDYIGIMEKKMETTIMGYIGVILGLYWVYIGIMEKTMETTVTGFYKV